MERNKMMKTARVLDKVLKILQRIAAFVGFPAAAAVTVVGLMSSRIAAAVSSAGQDTLNFGQISITGTSGAALLNLELMLKSLPIVGLAAAAMTGLLWFGLRLVRQILAPMKDGQPFISGISDKVRRLAIFVLVFGFFKEAASSILSGIVLNAFALTKLLNMQLVERITVNHTFSIDFIWMAALLFLLAYVFRYGEQLQQESDETL